MATNEELEHALKNALTIATRCAEISSLLALRTHQAGILPPGTSEALAVQFDSLAKVFDGDDDFAGHFHAAAILLRKPAEGRSG